MNTITTTPLSPARPEPKLAVGQIWRDPSRNRYYLLARTADCGYALINLETGDRWNNQSPLLTTAFGIRGVEFELVDNESVTITPPPRQS